jgi:hypothetical protein
MKRKKSFIVAAVMNLFIPGAGYFYLGRMIRGIIAFVLFTPLILLTAGIIWSIMTIDMVLIKSWSERKVAPKRKKCPFCSELIDPGAKECRFCHHKLKLAA